METIEKLLFFKMNSPNIWDFKDVYGEIPNQSLDPKTKDVTNQYMDSI